MRDGINLTRAGHPAIVFVYDNFERVARAQAGILGASDLRFYVYPQYQPGGDTRPVEEQKGATAAAAFSELLLERGK